MDGYAGIPHDHRVRNHDHHIADQFLHSILEYTEIYCFLLVPSFAAGQTDNDSARITQRRYLTLSNKRGNFPDEKQ